MSKERADYRVWVSDQVRYGDTDRQGHVNNAVYSTFFETGRVFALRDTGLVLGGAVSLVLARIEVDFRHELMWPDEIDIGTRVEALGRSSIRYGQAIFRGDLCVATGRSVVVCVDNATRRSTAIPDELRASLTELMASGSAG